MPLTSPRIFAVGLGLACCSVALPALAAGPVGTPGKAQARPASTAEAQADAAQEDTDATAGAEEVGVGSRAPAIQRAAPLFAQPRRKAAEPGAYDAAEPLTTDAKTTGDARRAEADAKRALADEDDAAPIDWILEDRKAAHRAHLLTFGLGLWPDLLSSHLWYAVPLGARGLLPRVNDGFALEFGSMFAWGRGDSLTLWPAVGVRWDFFLTHRWALFANLKFAVQILLNHDQFVRPNALVGFGGVVRLAERLLLRLELNYPQGLTVGLTIPLGGP